MVDASAFVECLLRTPRSPRLWSTLTRADVDLLTPALSDVEVASALRGLTLRRAIEPHRARQALQDYLDLPVTRHGHARLLPRIFELRSNLSAYDAAYVALAEGWQADLLSADERLQKAVRRHAWVPLAGEP